jgi:formylglycine-generating enzyme required for sulfatase activity
MIGIVLGLGCASVFCLAAYASNLVVLNIPGQVALAPDQTPTIVEIEREVTRMVIVTATDAPADNQSTPTVQPTAAAPTITPLVIMPTPLGGIAPAATNTLAGVLISTLTASVAAPVVGVTLPAIVPTSPAAVQPTELVNIPGGTFIMGTDIAEATRAIDDCRDRDGGTGCDISFTSDSIPPHSVTVNSFALERFEVTYQQYVDFRSAQPLERLRRSAVRRRARLRRRRAPQKFHQLRRRALQRHY